MDRMPEIRRPACMSDEGRPDMARAVGTSAGPRCGGDSSGTASAGVEYFGGRTRQRIARKTVLKYIRNEVQALPYGPRPLRLCVKVIKCMTQSITLTGQVLHSDAFPIEPPPSTNKV